jgi:DNA-binding response OmpR family regulator
METSDMLKDRHILVVEDDYLIAEIVVDYLEEAGAKVVGPIGVVDEALAFIETNSGKLDGAVLDVNLHGKKSYPIADALLARNVAFVFATGYGAEAVAEQYRNFPRCEKPFNEEVLIAKLTGVMK